MERWEIVALCERHGINDKRDQRAFAKLIQDAELSPAFYRKITGPYRRAMDEVYRILNRKTKAA